MDSFRNMYKKEKGIDFKWYLHGVSDGGTKVLFKSRSETHGLNEGIEINQHVLCVVLGVRVYIVEMLSYVYVHSMHVVGMHNLYMSSRVVLGSF